MKASEPELKVQERASLCSVAERIGLAVSDSMERRTLSEGAAESVRLEVLETAMEAEAEDINDDEDSRHSAAACVLPVEMAEAREAGGGGGGGSGSGAMSGGGG